MSEVDDARLRAVAGVSLHAPRPEYRVEGLSFGAAMLRRADSGDRWQSLTLNLRAPAATPGSNLRELRPSVLFILQAGSSGHDEVFYGARHETLNEFPVGTRALIVDHALLSNGAWLLDPTSVPEGLSVVLLDALDELRQAVQTYLDQPMRCRECAASAPRRRRGNPFAHNAHYLQMLRGLGISAELLDSLEPDPVSDCPHTPMRVEALKALFAQHPELAFEAIGALVPHASEQQRRFILNPRQVSTLLRGWLLEPRVTDPRSTFARRDAAKGPPDEAPQRIWPESVPRPAPPAPAPEPRPAEPRPRAARPRKVETPARAPELTPENAPQVGQMLMSAQLRAFGFDDGAVKRLLKEGRLERVDFGWYRWRG